MRRLAFLSLGLWIWTSDAWATETDPIAAEALFRTARKEADEGKFQEACAKFSESYRLDAAPGTLLNLGDCEESLGKLAHAWQHFQQLYEQLPHEDPRREIARARADAIEPKVPRLRIDADDLSHGANVIRDDVSLSEDALGVPLPIDPGRHEIVVSHAGHRDLSYVVFMKPLEKRELRVSEGEAIVGPTRVMGWTLVGVGAVGLVTGAAFGIASIANLSPTDSACAGNSCARDQELDHYNRARNFALATNISLVTGIVAVVAGVVVLLTSRDFHSAPSYSYTPMTSTR